MKLAPTTENFVAMAKKYLVSSRRWRRCSICRRPTKSGQILDNKWICEPCIDLADEFWAAHPDLFRETFDV